MEGRSRNLAPGTFPESPEKEKKGAKQSGGMSNKKKKTKKSDCVNNQKKQPNGGKGENNEAPFFSSTGRTHQSREKERGQFRSRSGRGGKRKTLDKHGEGAKTAKKGEWWRRKNDDDGAKIY